MRSKYSVLWYEDDPDVILEDIKPWLESFLSELGFILDFELLEKYKSQPPVFWQRFDLIVTDLNLEADGDGRRLIDDVRGGHILTDVLIYSANPAALKVAITRQPVLERMSFQFGRGDLERKLEELINLTIRKSQTLPHVRGQVIAEAIDLEIKLLQFLETYLAPKFVPEMVDAKKKSWAEFVKRKGKLLTRQAESVQLCTHETEGQTLHKLKFFGSFDAYELSKDSLEALAKYYQKPSPGDKPNAERATLALKVRTKLINFNQEVIDVRNTLAHVKEEKVGNEVVLKSRKEDGEETIINEAWCTATRKSLREHHENLERMVELLKAHLV